MDKTGLLKALQAILDTLKDAEAQALFGSPVDPVALEIPDYFEVIKEPKDLGTCLKNLQASLKGKAGSKRIYNEPAEVLRDVRLIWSNCKTYNWDNKPILEACDRIQNKFESLWLAAGLKGLTACCIPNRSPGGVVEAKLRVDPLSVDAGYEVLNDEVELPLRLLTDFAISSRNYPEQLIGLQHLSQSTLAASEQLVLQGALACPKDTSLSLGNEKSNKQRKSQRPATSADPQHISVTVTTWAIDYSEPVSVWAISQDAWYKLLEPSHAYQETYSSTLVWISLCRAAYQHLERAGTRLGVAQLVSECKEKVSSSEHALDDEAELFAQMQTHTLMEVKYGRRSSRAAAMQRSAANNSQLDVSRRLSRKRAAQDVVAFDSAAADQKHRRLAGGENCCTPAVSGPQRSSRKSGRVRFAGNDQAQKDVRLRASAGGKRRSAHTEAYVLPEAVISDVEEEGMEDKAIAYEEEDAHHEFLEDEDSGEDDDDEDDEVIGGFRSSRLRRQAWHRLKTAKQRAAKEEARRKEAAERAKREAEADDIRGNPPEPSQDFRLPKECIPELLLVWDFTQAFGDVLQLPPMSLPAFEAALDPGPKVKEMETGVNQPSALDAIGAVQGMKIVAGDQPASQPSGIQGSGEGVQNAEAQQGSQHREAQQQQSGSLPDSSVHMAVCRVSQSAQSGSSQGGGDINNEAQDELNNANTMEETREDVEYATKSTGKMDLETVHPTQNFDGSDDYEENDTQPDSDQESGVVRHGRGNWRGRGRGRGRSIKVAPQNVVTDPTIRTRRQRAVQEGIDPLLLSSRRHAPAYMQDYEIIEPTPRPRRQPVPSIHVRQAEREVQPTVKVKLKLGAKLTDALQAAQASHAELLHRKYGLTSYTASRLVPYDRGFGPSSVMLRDIFCGLLRGVEGRLEANAEMGGPGQPRMGKLQPPDAENVLPWPERVCSAIWGSLEAGPEAHAAAAKLGYGDFLDMLPQERLQLMSGLVSIALANEVFQAEVNQRVEAMAALRRRRDGVAGDELSDDEVPQESLDGAVLTPAVSTAGDAQAELPPSSEPKSSPEDWLEWIHSNRLGLRRALGEDCRGRRYWALGRLSGCFRVYVEAENGHDWGWYEGESLIKLMKWLQQGGISSEEGLLRSLQSAPLPLDVNRPGKLMSGTELAAQRVDGYRNLLVPLLRGEGNSEAVNPATAPEQRVLMCVEVLLGVMPLWFQERDKLRQHMSMCDILASNPQGREVAIVLLELERILSQEGALSDQWKDVWEGPWRRTVGGLTDVREASLMLAALQLHIRKASELLPRLAFLRLALEAQCTLMFPKPGDNVVVLRTGLLKHIDRYMQLLGLDSADDKAALDAAAGLPQVDSALLQARLITPLSVAGQPHPQGGLLEATDARVHLAKSPRADTQHTAAGPTPREDHLRVPRSANGTSEVGLHQAKHTEATDRAGEGSGPDGKAALAGHTERQVEGDRSRATGGQCLEDAPESVMREDVAQGADTLLAPPLKEESKERLRTCWEGLRLRVQSLRPVERYTVRSIVYRRHLVDASDVATAEDEDAAPRWPVAWLLLRPAKYGPKHQLPCEDIIVPVVIDNTLPDYLVKTEQYVQRMRIKWQPDDSFRMLISGKPSSKASKKKSTGTMYTGYVVDLEQAQPPPSATLREKESYDPWQSVVVQWDKAELGQYEHVNPWDMEIDPEEERRKLEEARKLQQAAARAARVRRYGEEGDGSEEERYAELVQQAERAQQMLRYLEQCTDPQEEVHYNEEVYGQPVQALFAPMLASPLLLGSSQPDEMMSAPAPRPSPATFTPIFNPGPLQSGQEVPEDVLEQLRPLDRESFTNMIVNFMNGLRGKFKIPIFAHTELDLHRVFWAVMERGGYEAVTGAKQWKDVCRCLGVDLSGQTSASYNMRQNYERCLMDFENYLASGQYEEDLAAGRAPEHTHVSDPSHLHFSLPSAPARTPALLPTHTHATRRGASAAAVSAVVAAEMMLTPSAAAAPSSGFQLLAQRAIGKEARPTPAMAAATPGGPAPQQPAPISLAAPGLHTPLPPSEAQAFAAAYPEMVAASGGASALWAPPTSVGQLPLPGIDLESLKGLDTGTHVLPAPPTKGESACPSWARLVSPPDAEGVQQPEAAAGQGWVAPTHGIDPVAPSSLLRFQPVAQQPMRTGEVLRNLGVQAVGRVVERYWPEEGGWWEAEISGWNEETGEHHLTYNRGMEDESFEIGDLSEFHDEEIRDPSAPQPHANPHDPFSQIYLTLQTGIPVEQVQAMAEAAANVHLPPKHPTPSELPSAPGTAAPSQAGLSGRTGDDGEGGGQEQDEGDQGESGGMGAGSDEWEESGGFDEVAMEQEEAGGEDQLPGEGAADMTDDRPDESGPLGSFTELLGGLGAGVQPLHGQQQPMEAAEGPAIREEAGDADGLGINLEVMGAENAAAAQTSAERARHVAAQQMNDEMQDAERSAAGSLGAQQPEQQILAEAAQAVWQPEDGPSDADQGQHDVAGVQVQPLSLLATPVSAGDGSGRGHGARASSQVEGDGSQPETPQMQQHEQLPTGGAPLQAWDDGTSQEKGYAHVWGQQLGGSALQGVAQEVAHVDEAAGLAEGVAARQGAKRGMSDSLERNSEFL